MIKYILIVLLVIAIAIVGPIITIWALNTLLPALNIPYTFWTWLAMAVLQFQIVGFKSSSK